MERLSANIISTRRCQKVEGAATECKMSAESRTLAQELPIRPIWPESRESRTPWKGVATPSPKELLGFISTFIFGSSSVSLRHIHIRS